MALERNALPNKLISEKSPYLLQHAYNPVRWYPWGDEAFRRAQVEGKPVFLSIGYSTCHWCHVMERESFDDSGVAQLLNDAFVCIKVDREERPDVDATYMKVCQMMTGGGGWPLTIIMTADKKPFFAATYIPRNNRFGRAGLNQIIPRIKQLWETRRGELVASAEKITKLLSEDARTVQETPPMEALGESTLDEAYLNLEAGFDVTHGGFGIAPKFPSPHTLSFLLRYWSRTRLPKALEMVEKTLNAMRFGGIYDHLASGFHRYATDAAWLVPHFEKMLYDQAMLTIAYTEAYQATGKDAYKQTAQQVIGYVLHSMTDPAGGFYSAEDADSEGEEGRFYVWTAREIRHALSPEEAEVFTAVFNIEETGNFADATTGSTTGQNILHMKEPLEEVASRLRFSPQKLQTLVSEACRKLLAVRRKRTSPSRDDKILTDWNGLTIAALAKASQVFGEIAYAEAAEKAADFILSNLRDAEGGLLHRYRDGEAGIAGFLDDYAFMVWSLIELYEATFEAKYLRDALLLADMMLARFWDRTRSGFYQIAEGQEAPLVRNKEIHDGAYPSGNSVAALNLMRLARITGEPRFEESADQLLQAFSREVSQAPQSYAQLMGALDFAVGPSGEVVIVGDMLAEDAAKMLGALRSKFFPRKVVLFRSSADGSPEIVALAPFTRDMRGKQGQATAFVCQDHLCKAPTTDVQEMLALLDYR